MRKKLLIALGCLLLVLAAAYPWLFLHSADADGAWPIDLQEVRRLAKSLEGELPTEIRLETVARFHFPAQVVKAGAGWTGTPMAAYAYQVVYPRRTGLIDTTM